MENKVSISGRVPDEVDGALGEYTRQWNLSKSEVIADAVANYLAAANYLEEVPNEVQIRMVRPFLRRMRRIFFFVFIFTTPIMLGYYPLEPLPPVALFLIWIVSGFYFAIPQILLHTNIPERFDKIAEVYTPKAL